MIQICCKKGSEAPLNPEKQEVKESWQKTNATPNGLKESDSRTKIWISWNWEVPWIPVFNRWGWRGVNKPWKYIGYIGLSKTKVIRFPSRIFVQGRAVSFLFFFGLICLIILRHSYFWVKLGYLSTVLDFCNENHWGAEFDKKHGDENQTVMKRQPTADSFLSKML